MRFPRNTTLGAVGNNALIYAMGKEIGLQAKRIGVHMNLSPVLDVNCEPENIVINVRSFGNSPKLVAKKGIAMIRGLQDAGIIASAKHFPGLGDISSDPHLDLPFSKHERKRLDEVELYPFAQAIKAGVLSIQTEHLMVSALEPDGKTPSSLSSKVVTDLLKNELGFKGLVISGALRMKALTNHIPDEEIILKAFLAGSDMLLMPQDFLRAYNTLKAALEEGKITLSQIDERVLKILQMKERVHLDQKRQVAMPTFDELHSPDAIALKETLYQKAITIARNPHRLIPLTPSKQVAYVELGDAPSTEFFDRLDASLSLETFRFPLEQMDETEEKRFLEKIDQYGAIVFAVYPADPRRIAGIRLMKEKLQQEELKNFKVHGIPESLARLVRSLEPYEGKTIVTYFGNPFGLFFFSNYSTLIMAYETEPVAQAIAAHLLLATPGD